MESATVKPILDDIITDANDLIAKAEAIYDKSIGRLGYDEQWLTQSITDGLYTTFQHSSTDSYTANRAIIGKTNQDCAGSIWLVGYGVDLTIDKSKVDDSTKIFCFIGNHKSMVYMNGWYYRRDNENVTIIKNSIKHDAIVVKMRNGKITLDD